MKNLGRTIADTWRGSPRLRFVVRTAVVWAAGYIVAAYRAGEPIELDALGWGAAVAAITAVVGLLTPAEPFVGPSFAKPDNVEVPAPPAKPAK